jgi:hypothetical protein
MSPAVELIEQIKANGGRLRVEEGFLVIVPKEAAAPILQDLRRHKAEIISLLEPRTEPAVDHLNAWRPNFQSWAHERCVTRKQHNDCGGIGPLLVDCAEWCFAHGAASPTRAVFEELLEDAGLVCINGLVLGLVLREDLDAVLRSQIEPLSKQRKGVQYQ